MAKLEQGRFVKLVVSGVQVETHYHETGLADGDAVIFAQTVGAGTSA